MIGIKGMEKEALTRLRKMDVGGVLEIVTYKRNRGIIILKEENDFYKVKEFGYHEEIFADLDEARLKKLLQKIAKREFPRSQQIRLYEHLSLGNHLISENPEIRI